jgi:hypothetical protein
MALKDQKVILEQQELRDLKDLPVRLQLCLVLKDQKVILEQQELRDLKDLRVLLRQFLVLRVHKVLRVLRVQLVRPQRFRVQQEHPEKSGISKELHRQVQPTILVICG